MSLIKQAAVDHEDKLFGDGSMCFDFEGNTYEKIDLYPSWEGEGHPKYRVIFDYDDYDYVEPSTRPGDVKLEAKLDAEWKRLHP